MASPCPTCQRLRGLPPDEVQSARGTKGAYLDPESGVVVYWSWRCSVCKAEGCAGCAHEHACTRECARCFAHNLPMVGRRCWCCHDPVTGLVCPACIGRSCGVCFLAGCRPEAPRCKLRVA